MNLHAVVLTLLIHHAVVLTLLIRHAVVLTLEVHAVVLTLEVHAVMHHVYPKMRNLRVLAYLHVCQIST